MYCTGTGALLRKANGLLLLRTFVHQRHARQAEAGLPSKLSNLTDRAVRLHIMQQLRIKIILIHGYAVFRRRHSAYSANNGGKKWVH